jgi:cell division protein FtsL
MNASAAVANTKQFVFLIIQIILILIIRLIKLKFSEYELQRVIFIFSDVFQFFF